MDEDAVRPHFDPSILEHRFIHRLDVCFSFLTRLLEVRQKLGFVPTFVFRHRLRVERVEIIFLPFELALLRDRADDRHPLLPPRKDVRQHIAERFKPDSFEPRLLLRFGQAVESLDVRSPFEIDVIQRALFGDGHEDSPMVRVPQSSLCDYESQDKSCATVRRLFYPRTALTKSANRPYAVSSGPPFMPSRSETITE